LAQVERVVVFDSGAAGGGTSALGRYATQLPVIVQQLVEGFSAVTGVDLTTAVRDRLAATPAADGAASDPPGPDPASTT
jgi:hypothetical protein